MFAALLITQALDGARLKRLYNTREAFASIVNEVLAFDLVGQIEKILDLLQLDKWVSDQLFTIDEQDLLQIEVSEPLHQVLVV